MNLLPLPAFSDNYIWLWHKHGMAVVVDPGDAEPVMQALNNLGLTLLTILITHHHADHVGGVDILRNATGAKVYGPALEEIPEPYIPLNDGDEFSLFDEKIIVMDVPGHTAGHIAFFIPNSSGQPILFCGDTLFSGGCGRLFEGTPAQMLNSLTRFSELPGDTQVCCAHEYTLSNLKFAKAVEPHNSKLIDYIAHCEKLRANTLPTLPSRIETEIQINPFMRTAIAEVQSSAKTFDPSAQDRAQVMAALRQWKNDFR